MRIKVSFPSASKVERDREDRSRRHLSHLRAKYQVNGFLGITELACMIDNIGNDTLSHFLYKLS